MWNWDNGHMDDGWGFVMMIGMLGIWALVAVAIVWFIRATKAPAVAPTMPSGDTNADSASASVTQSAEQILADRLGQRRHRPRGLPGAARRTHIAGRAVTSDRC